MDERKGSQRLPVNPRRHKVAPENRKRVATACNNCNVRRIKCSGEKPCKQCRSSSRDCIYPLPTEKITVSKSELDELKLQLAQLDKALQEVVPDAGKRKDLLESMGVGGGVNIASPPSPALSQMTRTGSIKSESVSVYDGEGVAVPEGRLLRDEVGELRFFGETSDEVMMDELKQTLGSHSAMISSQGQLLSSVGLYTTNDSQTIPIEDVDPLWLPSPSHTRAVLSELRHFIQDGAGQWSSGGIHWWGDLSSIPSTPMVSIMETVNLRRYRHLAFYHAALAVACRATSGQRMQEQGEAPLCETYFARAALLLENPLDVSKYTFGDAGAMSLMAFYLIESGRLDTAYTYISTAARISLLQGAHRGMVEEAGKRVFWTIYVLDRWIAMLTGRPANVPDEAIRLAPPVDAPGMPPAMGLKAHIELSRISDHIVNTVHGISPQAGGVAGSTSGLDKALAMLDQWRSSLSTELSLSGDGLSQDPAVCMLHMKHNQLLVVATRPWLLDSVKAALLADEHAQGLPTRTPSTYLRISLAAARHNIRLGRHLSLMNSSRGLLSTTSLRPLYNGAVVLLLQELAFNESMVEGEVATGRRMVDWVVETLHGEQARVVRELCEAVTRLKSARRGLSMTPVMDGGMGMGFEDMIGMMDHDWSISGV